MLHSLPRKSASSARRGATIAATPAQPRERADLLSHNSTVYNTKFSVTCQAMGAHSATISGPGVGTLQPALVLDASPVEAEPTPSPAPPPPSASHVIRPFDLDRDLDDLNAICANVYGGTDFMPREVRQLAASHRVRIVTAAAAGPGAAAAVMAAGRADQEGEGEGGNGNGVVVAAAATPRPVAGGQDGGRMDAFVCADRRGSAVFLFGLRVREEAQGRGLARTVMESACSVAPQELRAVSCAPLDSDQVASISNSGDCDRNGNSGQEGPAVGESEGDGSGEGKGLAGVAPPRHLVSVTVSWNAAAQRVLGRQLPGPIYHLAGWPSFGRLAAYEAEAGWVRGQPLPPSAPAFMDWEPRARELLTTDPRVTGLAPHWRRATGDAEVQHAVRTLLARHGGPQRVAGGAAAAGAAYGGPAPAGSCGHGHGPALRAGESHHGEAALAPLQELLWLPMPFEVWPLDSHWVQDQLRQGNVWLLTKPREEGASSSGSSSSSACGGARSPGSPLHNANGNAGSEQQQQQEGQAWQEAGGEGGSGRGCGDGHEEVLGVMLLAYFKFKDRWSAGVLAADSVAAASSILHTASLHPHFLWCSLDCGEQQQQQEEEEEGALEGAGRGAGGGSGSADPLSALFEATGGNWDFMVYGKNL